MIRLLLTLNLMLVVVVVGYILLVNNSLALLLRGQQEDYLQQLGQGTVQLLNESVAGLQGQALHSKFSELQQQFVYPLALHNLDELKKELDTRQFQRLQQGLIAGNEIDNADYLYGRVTGLDKAWKIAVDQTFTQDEINTAAGTFYLLQETFAKAPQEQWSSVLKQQQAQFGFPLALHRMQEAPLTDPEKQELADGGTVVIMHDSSEETLYQRLDGSDYVLQLGRFSPPWLAYYLNHFVFAVLALLLLVVSYLWLWPLWKNLMQLKTAADAFGNGDYSTRVPHHQRSSLSAVTAAFNAMAERTQNSIRSHKELTSAVSHELRTPVARMRFSLDMLADSNDPQERQRYIEHMNLDVEELDDLLEELLTYARFDHAGREMKMQWEPILPWFDRTLHDLERLADKKTLSWSSEAIDTDEVALFESALMSRVLNNLVQNALRYAESRVEVSLSKTGGDYVLQIDDDGLGIPESERERLFEAFTTLDDSRSRETGGFGLGLAIVKRIVDGHGGSVTIQDSALGGARFLVCWPQSG